MTTNSHNNPPKYYKHSLKIAGGIVLAFLVFAAGIYAGTKPTFAHIITGTPAVSTADAATVASGQDLSQLWEVWALLKQKYPFADKEPSDKDKIYGAIQGMVASYGDPYTVFFPPQEAKMFDAQVKGSFGGVGMEVGLKDSALVVIAPLKDSPAEKAGIKSGDYIVSIDGKKTEDMDVDTAVGLIRGDVGTTVDLGIARAGQSDTLHIKVTRDTVDTPIIDTAEKGDVFVISLYSFSEDSAQQFEGALQKFAASGKQKLVIDLRNNPGGYLDAAVDIASYFLPSGETIVREDSGNANPEVTHVSKGYRLLTNQPKVAILINGGSASASEILAGALQEQGVATLVGTTSYGKGSVQQVIDLDGGAAVKITVAKWLTPNGVSISDKGITPKIVVPGDPTLDPKTNVISDSQMDAAVKFLDGKK